MWLTFLSSPGVASTRTSPTETQWHSQAAQRSEPSEESPSSASLSAEPGSLPLDVEGGADMDWHRRHKQTLTNSHTNALITRKSNVQTRTSGRAHLHSYTHAQVQTVTDKLASCNIIMYLCFQGWRRKQLQWHSRHIDSGMHSGGQNFSSVYLNSLCINKIIKCSTNSHISTALMKLLACRLGVCVPMITSCIVVRF